MRHIILPAHLQSDLDWKLPDSLKEPILWELDFGFKERVFLSDQAAFQAYIFAIEQFSKMIPSKRVVLYRGSLDIIHRIVLDSEEIDEVEAAEAFGDFLHRLASFLPEGVEPFCLFESSPFGRGRSAQLMSKVRFWHLKLSLEESTSPVGVLLPSDEQCTPEVLKQLEVCMDLAGPHRMIPEKRLNEMWEGLERLYVIPESVSSQGKRHLMGFEAAGGEIVRSRGI